MRRRKVGIIVPPLVVHILEFLGELNLRVARTTVYSLKNPSRVSSRSRCVEWL
jgi:hypothetical protein